MCVHINRQICAHFVGDIKNLIESILSLWRQRINFFNEKIFMYMVFLPQKILKANLNEALLRKKKRNY